MVAESNGLYLGLDLSTQSLDAVVIDLDEALESAFEASVNFETDLPHYGTKSGFIYDPESKRAVAPTLMFAEALELVLERLRSAKCPFERIRAVSVSAQQHGSVYWQRPPHLPDTEKDRSRWSPVCKSRRLPLRCRSALYGRTPRQLQLVERLRLRILVERGNSPATPVPVPTSDTLPRRW
jgi:hypothetical protein